MRTVSMTRALTYSVVAAIAATVSPAQAATIFTTSLLGSNESPPVVSTGAGIGELMLADDMNSFSVLINFSGLGSNAVAGHVHCCTATGSNTGVAIGFTVPRATAGTIMGTYDLTMTSTYTGAFLLASGGTAAGARARFLGGLSDGLAYLNVHTVLNPGGEIRGQLGAVPEAETWAMMLIGFGMLGAAMRYGRKNVAISFA